MNKLVKASMISLAAVAVLSMTGCGSDDSSSSNGGTGKAVDGYIKGARVFFDFKKNGAYDAGVDKMIGVTDETGSYNLNNVSKDDIEYAKVNDIPVVVTDGIDTDSGNNFKGSIKAIFDGKATLITPLTSIAQKYYSLVDDANISESYSKAAKVFGLTAADLEKDPRAVAIEDKNATLLAKAMVLHHLAVAAKSSESAVAGELFESNGTIKSDINLTKDTTVADLLKDAGVVSDAKLISLFKSAESVIRKVTDGNTSEIKDLATIIARADDRNTSLTAQLVSVMNLLDKNDGSLDQLTKLIVENNTTGLTTVIKKSMVDANITPKLSFGRIRVEQTVDNTSDEASIDSTGDFNQTLNNIKKAPTDKNITAFDIKLGNFVANPCKEVEANLTIDAIDTQDAGGYEYNLTFPVIIVSENGVDLNITIPAGSDITTDTNDTAGSDTKYTVAGSDIVIMSDSNGYVDFNMSKINNGLIAGDKDANFTNEANNTMNKVFDKSALYNFKISITDINDSSVNGLKVSPSIMKGDLNITK